MVPLLGLVLVALFLGHDLLMAAPPHHPSAAPRHHGSVVALDSRHLPPDPHGPGSGHPEDCGIGQSVAVRRVEDAGQPKRLPPALAGPSAPGLVAVAPSPPAAWTEPQWPPATKRALWQVFRI